MAGKANWSITQEEFEYIRPYLTNRFFENPQRTIEICQLRLAGCTYSEIGGAVGCSSQRVQQLLYKVKKIYEYRKRMEGNNENRNS